MAQIKQTTFSRIGNLAFYDGWSPNYIYLNTLANAGHYYIRANGPSAYSPSLAQPIADQAIADAKAHSTLNINDKESSDEYFLSRFEKIISFLEQAYNAELSNEQKWVEKKIKQLKLAFGEDSEEIPVVKQLFQTIENADTGIDYDNFITIINIIQQGLNNTKIIAKHESERITEIKKLTNNLIQSRKNQVRGLLNHQKKNISEQETAATNSALKLWNNFKIEYLQRGGLTGTHTDKKTNQTKFNVFGGARFNKIKKTVDNVLARWAEDVIKEIIHNPSVISQIAQQLQIHYPVAGNFKLLEPEIRETIIIAIIQYGLSNLNTILNQELNDIIIQEVENQILTDQSWLDHASQLNIHGLEAFGQNITESALFKDAKTIEDTLNNHAYKLIDMAGQAIKLMDKKDQSSSFLYQALNNRQVNKGRGEDNWEKYNQIIKLIDELDKLQKEYNKIKENYNKQTQKKSEAILKQVKLNNNDDATINITIKNGNVEIEQSDILKALERNEAFKKLGFKTFNPQTLKTTIIAIKARATTNLRNDLITSIKTGVADLSESEIISGLSKELSQVKIHINGPELAEVVSSMNFRAYGKNIVVDLTGPTNAKNDVVTIEFEYRNLITSLKNKLAPRISQSKLQEFEKISGLVEKAQQEFLQEYSSQITQEVVKIQSQKAIDAPDKYTQTGKKVIQDIDHLDEILEDKYNELKTAVDAYEAHLKTYGFSQQQISQHIGKMLPILEQSFYISTTVKTYNTYINQIGFLGGSLGPDFDSQIDRVADIFENAGLAIPQHELEWIKSAILNCFPGSVVGTKNKNLIENYLGALMAFALFDEGGAESAMISDFYKTYFQSLEANAAGPEILHLYKVNTLYVPGSLVIKRTLDSLKNEVIPFIQQIPNTMKRGAGVEIINNASTVKILNRPIYAHQYNPDPNAWAAAGIEAKKQIKIQILFLAGLLDIINGINTTLGNIEIPK